MSATMADDDPIFLTEWSCGHVTSSADEEPIDYSQYIANKEDLPLMMRRCPNCRLKPFVQRMEELQVVTVQFMCDGTVRSNNLRAYIDKLCSRYDKRVTEYIMEGESGRTFSQTLMEPDSGIRLCANWMVIETVMMGAYTAELEDVECAIKGVKVRLGYLEDVVETMGGMLAKPQQWISEFEETPQVARMYENFVAYVEEIRDCITKHIHEREGVIGGFEKDLGYLRELWKAQQDETCRLLTTSNRSNRRYDSSEDGESASSLNRHTNSFDL
ncbi:hypothetical protein F5X99DRAFT_367770 [Biscogniauxia marginata]|nr:hypothetical protein F5X99DRAFT_367770 [Biscogniauxia marginata]